MGPPRMAPVTSLNRAILALAIPALATLVVEPLLIVADTVIVGMLGTSQLAGLTMGSSVLGVVVGLCIFLAYGTTATVSRRLGAGDRAGAIQGGMDGMALGAVVGVGLALLMVLFAPVVVGWFGSTPAASEYAATYLRIVAAGVPAQLVILASTGVLRGLQDTRTPLVVMVGITVLNVLLNVTFVFGLNLGIGGAALGTALAQWTGAVALATAVRRAGRGDGVAFRFAFGPILAAARAGMWLLMRSATLHAALVVTTYAAAGLGETSLAAHQAANSVWMVGAYAMDALAIAAQALVGHRLGAGQLDEARGVLRRVLLWGVVFGGVLGVALVVARPWLAAAFTPDDAVRAVLVATFPALALILPIGAVTFMYDGVLIGAGDARYLAVAGLVSTAVYVPFALWAREAGAGLFWLWCAYGVWLAARAATLWWRTRGDAWARLGAEG